MARPKGIPFSEEYASSNYAEFSVSRKPDHTIKLRRLLLVLLYIIFAALYCTLFLVIWKMAPLIAILPLLLLIHRQKDHPFFSSTEGQLIMEGLMQSLHKLTCLSWQVGEEDENEEDI